MSMRRIHSIGVLAWVLTAPFWVTSVAAQERTCVRCHANLEFLTDFAPQRAESLHIESVGGPHSDFSCSDCHDGFNIFPHEASSETWHCSNCHDDVAEVVSQSPHSSANGVDCGSCHGIHDVIVRDSEGARRDLFDASCTRCHADRALQPGDVHRGAISCVDCHGSHDANSHRDANGRVAGVSEAEACGACHEGPYAAWNAGDIHHERLLESGVGTSQSELDPATNDPDPPSCSTCHGGHGVQPVGTAEFALASSDRCIACHVDFGRRSADTYHTRAVRLGRPDAASCTDCHRAHGILPETDPRSSVHESQRLSTCQQCHESATALFASYDSHPIPTNRHRNPALFYSFLFMNILLVGVLGVFILHTIVWWIRIRIDQRKEAGEE